MRKVLLSTTLLAFFGCSNQQIHHGTGVGPTTGPSGTAGGGGTGTGGTGSGGTSGGGSGGTTTNCVPGSQTQDNDGDGYTPAQGDCNDCNPSINPGATDVDGDPTDYDCDGTAGDPKESCDSGLVGKTDAPSIAQSIELCDARFLKNAVTTGPSDPRARNIMSMFGTKVMPHKGNNMTLISSGIAVDATGKGYVNPQKGTILSDTNTYTNPLPNLKGAANCSIPIGPSDNTNVNDYTEITLTMHAPSNANSFSFDFQFFSGEYPVYVCSSYNDQFLAVVQSTDTYPTATNISFDQNMNPITVNSGFFTICDNVGTLAQTNNCKTAPSAVAGTGYDVAFNGSDAPGGSTGWLTTTAPIKPNEDFTLRLVVFDEYDHQLDSAALIDNFRWGVTQVTGPVTGPITQLIQKHHRGAAPRTVRSPAPSSLMCGA